MWRWVRDGESVTNCVFITLHIRIWLHIDIQFAAKASSVSISWRHVSLAECTQMFNRGQGVCSSYTENQRLFKVEAAMDASNEHCHRTSIDFKFLSSFFLFFSFFLSFQLSTFSYSTPLLSPSIILFPQTAREDDVAWVHLSSLGYKACLFQR